MLPFNKRYHYHNSHKPNSRNGFGIFEIKILIKTHFEYYLCFRIKTKGNIFVYVKNGVHLTSGDI